MAKIAIDAGHGLYTSGKRCLKAVDPKETREWVLNSRIATRLEELLKSAGHTVLRVDDTTGSVDISLTDRVKKANSWGADFYMSVHHNAAGTGKVFTGGGTEVYVCKNASEISIKMQNAIYKQAKQLAKLTGDNRSDGTRAADFYVVKNTKMPSCLIECGFMDSKHDIKQILDNEWAMSMALAIAKGICEVLGGKVNTSTKTEEAKKTTTTKKEESKKPAKLVEDGSWGKKTTYAVQYVLNVTSDGLISNQPQANKKLLLSVSEDSWKFKATGYSAGSKTIKEIQELCGIVKADRDGLFGKESIKALQKFLKKQGLYSGLISGKLNKNVTIGFQKYLNKQMGY